MFQRKPNSNLDLALLEAADNGNLQSVQRALNLGANVNAKTQYGLTALMIATRVNNLEVAKLLLAAGADVHIRNVVNNTAADLCNDDKLRDLFKSHALMQAMKSGDLEAAQKTMSADIDLEFTDTSGNTLLMIAITNGYTEIVEQLLAIEIVMGVKDGININNITNKAGETALTIARKHKQAKIIKLLEIYPVEKAIRRGWDDVFVHLLKQAELNNNIELVGQILELSKGKVDLSNTFDSHHLTPLTWAAATGKTRFVKVLIETGNANVNLGNTDGMTALMQAATWGHTEIVKMLLKAGANLNIKNKAGETALSIAKKHQHKEMVKLLESPSIEAAIQAGNEKLILNFLFEGIREANVGLVRNIINMSKDKIDLRPKNVDYNLTPLMLACLQGQLEITRLLIESGIGNINLINMHGESALNNAVSKGHAEIVKLLLECGADVNIKNKAGETALSIAKKHQHKEMIKLLETHSIDKAIKDANINAIAVFLRKAVKKNDIGLIKRIIDQSIQSNIKINLEIRDKEGLTPLMLAAWRGLKEMVELLLKQGADINAKSSKHFKMTPILYAIQSGNIQTIEYLLKAGAELPHENILAHAKTNTDVREILKNYLFKKWKPVLRAVAASLSTDSFTMWNRFFSNIASIQNKIEQADNYEQLLAVIALLKSQCIKPFQDALETITNKMLTGSTPKGNEVDVFLSKGELEIKIEKLQQRLNALRNEYLSWNGALWDVVNDSFINTMDNNHAAMGLKVHNELASLQERITQLSKNKNTPIIDIDKLDKALSLFCDSHEFKTLCEARRVIKVQKDMLDQTKEANKKVAQHILEKLVSSQILKNTFLSVEERKALISIQNQCNNITTDNHTFSPEEITLNLNQWRQKIRMIVINVQTDKSKLKESIIYLRGEIEKLEQTQLTSYQKLNIIAIKADITRLEAMKVYDDNKIKQITDSISRIIENTIEPTADPVTLTNTGFTLYSDFGSEAMSTSEMVRPPQEEQVKTQVSYSKAIAS